MTPEQLSEFRRRLEAAKSERARVAAPETECCAGTFVFLRGLNAGLDLALLVLDKMEAERDVPPTPL